MEGDFPSLQAYNDYLEEVETIGESPCQIDLLMSLLAMHTVYNLCHGVDVEQTKERMEQYRKEHQTLIMRNRERKVGGSCILVT